LGFETETAIYFVLRERPSRQDAGHCRSETGGVPISEVDDVTRLVRICKGDRGGLPRISEHFFGTLAKADLVCQSKAITEGFRVRTTRRFTFTHATAAQWDTQAQRLYAVFATDTPAPKGSAVCVYGVTSLEHAFKGPVIPTFSSSAKSRPEPRENPFPNICEKFSSNNLTEEELSMGRTEAIYLRRHIPVFPIFGHAVAMVSGKSWTSITGYQVATTRSSKAVVNFVSTVLWLGMEDQLLQVVFYEASRLTSAQGLLASPILFGTCKLRTIRLGQPKPAETLRVPHTVKQSPSALKDSSVFNMRKPWIQPQSQTSDWDEKFMKIPISSGPEKIAGLMMEVTASGFFQSQRRQIFEQKCIQRSKMFRDQQASVSEGQGNGELRYFMVFSVALTGCWSKATHAGELFVTTSASVYRLTTDNCDSYKTSLACTTSADPHCAWNTHQAVCISLHRTLLDKTKRSMLSTATLIPAIDRTDPNKLQCPRAQNSGKTDEHGGWSEWHPCQLLPSSVDNSAGGRGGSWVDRGDQITCLCRTCRSTTLCKFGEQQVSKCTVKGLWTPWSEWSECVANVKRRVRRCVNPFQESSTAECQGPTQEAKPCELPSLLSPEAVIHPSKADKMVDLRRHQSLSRIDKDLVLFTCIGGLIGFFLASLVFLSLFFIRFRRKKQKRVAHNRFLWAPFGPRDQTFLESQLRSSLIGSESLYPQSHYIGMPRQPRTEASSELASVTLSSGARYEFLPTTTTKVTNYSDDTVAPYDRLEDASV
uniref:Sema domain-containing protein n=1 Tax=Schistocephalus solidus TaxID=70667 RepID=A0A183T9C7_SCHSO